MRLVPQLRESNPDKAPLYVRVRHLSRERTGMYTLVARRHLGYSKEDAYDLNPGQSFYEVRKATGVYGERQRWFRLQTECPTSGRPQSIAFFKQPPLGSVGQHHLITLQEEIGGSLHDVAAAVECHSALECQNPMVIQSTSFNGGGHIVYAQVFPFVDTPSENYFVRWTNNLTVFEPGILTNVDPVDNDCWFINCADDELGRMNLRVTLAGTDVITPIERSLPFPDFDNGDQVDLRPFFPMIRFLSDERLEIEFTEFDDTLTREDDHLLATVFPLPPEAPSTPERATVVSGAGGAYSMKGFVDHFSRHALSSCTPP